MKPTFSKSKQVGKINLLKPKKVVSKGKSYWKKKAWAQFSIYIRRKYIEYQDYVQCYTCGTLKPWKQMQAGHGIAGRKNAVLFMEEIVRPQCTGCNLFGGGKYDIFTYNLIKELGIVRYEEIVMEAQKTVQYKVSDYQRIFEQYKEAI